MATSHPDDSHPSLQDSLQKRDFILLIFIAVILVGIFIILAFKLIDQEDAHVKNVEKVHVNGYFGRDSSVRSMEAEQSVKEIVDSNLEVKEAGFQTFNIGNRAMEDIARLKRLQKLDISNTKVTDDGLKYLIGLKLRVLDLSGLAISDRGLRHVAQISTLEKLNLHSTGITDSGVETVSLLSHLNNMTLSSTKVTDACGPSIAKLQALERLYVSNTKLTDAVMPEVHKLKKLRAFYVDDTAITIASILKYRSPRLHKLSLEGCAMDDDDVKKLVHEIPGLTAAHLGHTAITDKSLHYLAELKELQSLYVPNCMKLTKAGLDWFRKERPDCQLQLLY